MFLLWNKNNTFCALIGFTVNDKAAFATVFETGAHIGDTNVIAAEVVKGLRIETGAVIADDYLVSVFGLNGGDTDSATAAFRSVDTVFYGIFHYRL